MRLLLVLAVLSALAAAQDVRTGWWRGRQVVYRIVDGLAVAEGDIILGTPEEIPAEEPEPEKVGGRDSITVLSERYLWPEGRVAYEIDPGLPNQGRVTAAIEHWSARTPLTFVQRTTERAYVRFVRRPGICNSFVGMIGREQTINLGDECSTGAVIHEIGHAIGLFHEQSRRDRQFYVEVAAENIAKADVDQFDQALTDGRDAGGYDYGSIMHYDVMAFSRNGRPAIRTVPPGIPVSQREALSAADIDAAKRLYRFPIEETTITTFPVGLEIEVDGQRYKAPRSFRWAPGSTHTLNVPGPQMDGPYRYIFGRWSDDGDASRTIVASGETTVYTANFVRQARIDLTVSPTAAGRLEVSPAAEDGWLPAGAEIVVRAVPNGANKFRGWTGFGTFSTHGVSPNPLRFVARDGLRYTANFTTAPVTMITSDPPGLKVMVDGETVTTPRGYTWAPGSSHTVAVNDVSQKDLGDTARYTFLGWSDDGAASHSVVAGSGDMTVAARFKTEHRVTFGPAANGNFAASPQVDGGFYEAGTTIQLQPQARDGFRFAGWRGDLGGADSPGSLVVDDQKSVTASFAAPRQLSTTSLVNAADFKFAGGIAPLSLVSIFAPEIGSTGSVRVTFDEHQGVVTAIAADQVNVAVPAAIVGRETVTVRVQGNGWLSNARMYGVLPSNPALFSFDGRMAAALNQNYTVNSVNDPAARGSIVMLYATGVAQGPVRVRVAGREVPVHYAGQAPGMVDGVQQINIEIPSDVPAGVVPILVRAGTAASLSPVYLAVQ